MNEPREYSPTMFELLGEPPAALSKVGLAKVLTAFLRRHQLEVFDTETHTRYIELYVPVMKQLTGLEEDRFYLTKNNVHQREWWEFVTCVYERWISRNHQSDSYYRRSPLP